MKLWVQVCSYLHSNGDLCTTNQSIANWAEMEHKYESGAIAMRWGILQYESYNRLVSRALRASNQSSTSVLCLVDQVLGCKETKKVVLSNLSETCQALDTGW